MGKAARKQFIDRVECRAPWGILLRSDRTTAKPALHRYAAKVNLGAEVRGSGIRWIEA